MNLPSEPMKNPKPVPTSNCALLASIIIHHLNKGHFVMDRPRSGVFYGESFLGGKPAAVYTSLEKKDVAEVSVMGLTATIKSKELADAVREACRLCYNKSAEAFVAEAKAGQILKEMREGGAR